MENNDIIYGVLYNNKVFDSLVPRDEILKIGDYLWNCDELVKDVKFVYRDWKDSSKLRFIDGGNLVDKLFGAKVKGGFLTVVNFDKVSDGVSVFELKDANKPKERTHISISVGELDNLFRKIPTENSKLKAKSQFDFYFNVNTGSGVYIDSLFGNGSVCYLFYNNVFGSISILCEDKREDDCLKPILIEDFLRNQDLYVPLISSVYVSTKEYGPWFYYVASKCDIYYPLSSWAPFYTILEGKAEIVDGKWKISM